MPKNPAIEALRHHVSGAIARGEKEAIVERVLPHRCAGGKCEQDLGTGAMLRCEAWRIEREQSRVQKAAK